MNWRMKAPDAERRRLSRRSANSRLRPAALAVVAASGCASSDGLMRITTTPAGAKVSIDGYGSCVTPCTVEILSPVKARVAKAGFRQREVDLAPGGRDMEIALELAAPAGDVEEEPLPEI